MYKLFVTRKILYDGSQIESLWAASNFQVFGDSIVSFIGPCDIKPENIVDTLDKDKKIKSPMMLHFIVEHFDPDLEKAVLHQRILASLVKDEIELVTKKRFKRKGDDLWDGDRKLTISVATCGSISAKIHFGINIKQEKGVDVKTAGLSQYKINPRLLARRVMREYREEIKGIEIARHTVRPIR